MEFSRHEYTGVGCHALLQGTSPPRDQTWVSHMAGRFFTDWTTREVPIVAQIKTLTWNGKWFQHFYSFYLNIRNLWWTKNMHKEVFYRRWRIEGWKWSKKSGLLMLIWASFSESSVGKESACSAGDLGSIPGLGRFPEEGKCYWLQYSGLENSRDGIVHGIAKSWTWLNNFHTHYPELILVNNSLPWWLRW